MAVFDAAMVEVAVLVLSENPMLPLSCTEVVKLVACDKENLSKLYKKALSKVIEV